MGWIRSLDLTFPTDDNNLPTMPAGKIVMTKDLYCVTDPVTRETIQRKVRVWYEDLTEWSNDERRRHRQCMLIPDGNGYSLDYEHAVSIIMNDGSLQHLVRQLHG